MSVELKAQKKRKYHYINKKVLKLFLIRMSERIFYVFQMKKQFLKLIH
ncbi:hypothetical protein VCSRO96_2927 [Vibrio cholerae]|nr:hypothetical protein VCSRO96_2927 [Vibrio cholerae]